MRPSKIRVQIIGFDRKDEGLVRFKKKSHEVNEPPPRVIFVPGCARLTEGIFRAAGLAVEMKSLGSIGRSRRVELAFDDKKHLRARKWEARVIGVSRAGKARMANRGAPCDAIVAQLRWTDAREIFHTGESGLHLFSRRAAARLSQADGEVVVLFMLGIIPGPTVPAEQARLLLEAVSAHSAKNTRHPTTLLTDADSFRNSGYRVREDGSTSAAVEDLCGVVLAQAKGGSEPQPPNLSAAERQAAGTFFSVFNQILIRIRCDCVLQFWKGEFGEWTISLHFVIEGDRQNWFRYGEHVFGLNAVMAAVIISDLVSSRERPVSDALLQAGIYHAWNVVERGLCKRDDAKEWTKEKYKCLRLGETWKWWTQKETRKSGAPASQGLNPVQCITIPGGKGATIRHRNRWTFFREVCLQTRIDSIAADSTLRGAINSARNGESAGLWDVVSKQIARKGPEAAREMDATNLHYRVFKLGKVQSVDREEIDGLISVQRLIFTYLGLCLRPEKRPEHPLCIGVFGAPGSGKSFGVKEIARSLNEWEQPVPKKPLEFNIAQFKSRSELSTALHRVRDLRLETDTIPVAIFDEFDAEFEARPFGWLRYFLMPMHDGQFVDGTETYHTGNAVFIFAGGINHSFAEFSSRQRDRDFCEAKGPDFISRLRGIHNVPSLNRSSNSQNSEFPGWKIRRAILLHTNLERHGVAIDDDALLHAFLGVTSYRHGARSLGALIEMCARQTGRVIGRASLPPRDQLDLHVDAREFWSLLRDGHP